MNKLRIPFLYSLLFPLLADGHPVYNPQKHCVTETHLPATPWENIITSKTWQGKVHELQGQKTTPSTTIAWLKAGSARTETIATYPATPAITPANIIFNRETNTLTFHPTQLRDAGLYICVTDCDYGRALYLNLSVTREPPVVIEPVPSTIAIKPLLVLLFLISSTICTGCYLCTQFVILDNERGIV
ncbi:ORF10 [turkey adenovirus 5]|uniref:ORF10 n=1 Tax=turkey adenovirus 5 TaxID=1408258 RepID=U5NER2_9ADEN|nr:ORF10 [Turkey aviadenovirus 5]AGX93358.1 ORF10 [Turkey aviadenovirus 5]